MKREVKTAFAEMKKGRFTTLPTKIFAYGLRRMPRLKDHLTSRKLDLQIQKQLLSNKNKKANFEKTTVVYLLNNAEKDLLTRSIFSLKKLVLNPHVVVIDLGNNDESIWSVVQNYLPKSVRLKADDYGSLEEVFQLVSKVVGLRDYVFFINEFARFNELVNVLDKKELKPEKIYAADFLYPRMNLTKVFIDRQEICFYENMNLFRSFFPIIPKERLETLTLRQLFYSDFTILPAAITIKELNDNFDKHNLFRQQFELLFPVSTIEEHHKINHYKLPFSGKVSVIILTKNRVDLLEPCIASIRNSSYKNYEIIIVDHESDSETQEYFRTLDRDTIKVVPYSGKFNFSHMNNVAAKVATGDVLCFLNNDTEVISKEWMEVLAGFAVQDTVGAVGAKLLFANGLIQHAGILINKNYTATSHILTYEKDNSLSKELKVISSPDALTGACLFVAKNKFDEIGGFDENYEVLWQDVDICLSLERRGYKTLFIPYVKLYHYESSTRKANPSPKEILDTQLFTKKWAQADTFNKKEHTFNLQSLKKFGQGLVRNEKSERVKE